MEPLSTGAAGNAECPWDKFDPQWYLEHNYRSLRAEDAQILEQMRDHFISAEIDSAAVGIDVGPGSNLYPSLAMLPFCDEIVLWEYGTANVAWLRQEVGWYRPCWDAYWSVLSSRPPYELVDNPREALRNKARVRHGNLFRLGQRRFDVGTTFFVAESITSQPSEFQRALEHFVSALRPSAPFAAAFMRSSLGYAVGAQMFPAVAVTEDDVKQCFIHLSCEVELKVQVPPASPLRDGYDGTILALGRAPGRVALGRRAQHGFF